MNTNYDKKQWSEQKRTNLLLYFNTVFTVFAGLGGLKYVIDVVNRFFKFII